MQSLTLNRSAKRRNPSNKARCPPSENAGIKTPAWHVQPRRARGVTKVGIDCTVMAAGRAAIRARPDARVGRRCRYDCCQGPSSTVREHLRQTRSMTDIRADRRSAWCNRCCSTNVLTAQMTAEQSKDVMSPRPLSATTFMSTAPRPPERGRLLYCVPLTYSLG